MKLNDPVFLLVKDKSSIKKIQKLLFDMPAIVSSLLPKINSINGEAP